MLTIVENLNWLSSKNGFSKFEQRHVGPAPWSIDCEKAQASGGKAIEVAIGVRHEFVRFFASGVEAQWVVYILVYRKRHGCVGAVNAGAAGINQVFNPMVSAAFQNVRKTDDVTVDVGQRIFYGISYTSLGSEINHALGLVRGKSELDRLTVGQVDTQVNVVWMIGMAGQTRFFDSRIIIIVVVVNADNFIATFKQTKDEVRANEPSGTSDEVGNIHTFKLTDAIRMRLQL